MINPAIMAGKRIFLKNARIFGLLNNVRIFDILFIFPQSVLPVTTPEFVKEIVDTLLFE